MIEPLIWFLRHLARTRQDRATSNNPQLAQGECEEKRRGNGKEKREKCSKLIEDFSWLYFSFSVSFVVFSLLWSVRAHMQTE